jgi:hypothetical protein
MNTVGSTLRYPTDKPQSERRGGDQDTVRYWRVPISVSMRLALRPYAQQMGLTAPGLAALILRNWLASPRAVSFTPEVVDGKE